MGAMHNCKTKIIPYVLTWDGIVTKFHKSHSKEIGLTKKIDSYIQFIVLKKTLENILFEYRRDGEDTNQEIQEILAKVSRKQMETEADVKVMEELLLVK